MSLPGTGGGPPPPPPPPPGNLRHDLSVPVLPQINIPKPRSKMKTLQWQKIPVNNVIGKSNIWTIIGRLEKKYEMDYEKMDELFSLNHDSGPKRSSHDTDGVPDHKKKKENTEGLDRLNGGEINILDGKRSLNVNIFLKQFRMEHEEMVQLVREGRCEKFGAERLRSLLKLLPSQEEIDAINAFEGDIDKLGNAEKFFICLMKLPNYRMRIEGLLIMEEFNVNMEWIRPSIESVIQAAKDIEENQSLKELIYLILISGNYLNSGNYAGNAAGFKLSSLLKLTEIRANKPKMNLMHYVAQEAEEKNPKLLRFPDEMTFLKDAAQVSVEALTTDINNIASKVRAITEQIVVAGADFQQQMAFFLKEANVEVVELEEDLKDIDGIKQELATFFCEDIKTFKLEECFRILQTFCERLKKATEENLQRRLQEDKAERRRTSKESKSHRTSKDVSELSDQTFDHSHEEDEGFIVDMLLADVRSGYASRKFNDGNFSVTKVTKVNLNSPDVSVASIDSPVNGSSPTPDSLLQRRSRRSYATEDNESLLDFLNETASSEKPEKLMSHSERYATLRRRRLERKAKQSVLEVIERDRERNSSPTGIKTQSTPICTSTSDVQMRHSDNIHDRSKSDTYSNSNGSRKLQRSKSWLDRPSVDKASLEQRRKELKDDTDESDALIRRIKQRLSKRDGRYTPPISEEGDGGALRTDLTFSHQDTTPMTRKSSRIHSGISENSSPLGTIAEKNFNLDDFSLTSQTNIKEKQTHSKMPDQVRNNLSPNELSEMLKNIDSSSSAPKHSQNVMVSMRKKISSGMGTDIDGVLKTIEDTGRQIDTVGVTGPMKRTPDSGANKIQPQPQVAVVAHLTASNIPEAPLSEQELKTKRDKRKKRSTLSVDDVKAAMKLSSSVKDTEVGISRNSSLKSKSSSSHVNNSTSTAKTPPTQRRLRSNSDKTDGEKVINDEGSTNKDMNKAAKLAAARKKFRGARFGVSCTSDINSSVRARSNVESDSVDQALKELASQNSMSRSKSYDEHVAKKALTGEEEFTSNNIMRMNSGSAPDTSAEKSAVMRNSLNRLSMDGRRNGLYIPSDESDTELKPEDIGTRRPSKSDSTKSFSQLSLKSVNTSTETLPAEIEPSAEQSVKNKESLSHKDMHNNASVNKNVRSNISFPSDTTVNSNTNFKEHSTLRRSSSLMERHKNIEEESDSPLAAVAQWRMRRAQQRRSVYDNMNENDVSESAPSSLHNYVRHLKSEENDLKNEAGSRSSYASSNDKDEGFETSSGTMSQRTSMSSNFEAEMHNTPTLSRRAERSKGNVENFMRNKSVINTTQVNDSVISRLSEEAERKERTQNWTEQTVRVNGDTRTGTDGEFHNVLSAESGHITSKVGIWSDETAFSSNKSTLATKQIVALTPSKKTPTKEDATKHMKPKTVPSYMLPTSSSANKPAQNKLASTTKTDTTASTPAFTRNTPSRTSDMNLESKPAFKRDTVRASMRAETATASFQRGTAARTSIRGPRTSVGTPKSFLSPPASGRTRSDSNASVSSTASGTSNISATPSTVSEATRRRLTPTSNIGTPTSPSNRPTMLSLTHKSPTHQSPTSPTRAIAPASHTIVSATPTPTSSGLTRSHSMRVTPGRTSLGTPVKHSTPSSVTGSNRSTTPLIDKSPNKIHLQERPQNTTPFSSEDKSPRRSSFMAPTASSKAKVDEQTPVAPPRTKSLHSTQNVSSFSHSASLRVPKNVSGRESPAPTEISFHHRPDHHQSLSTVNEQIGDEDKEKDTSKKPASIFKRLSTTKSKVSPGGAKTSGKSNIIFTKK